MTGNANVIAKSFIFKSNILNMEVKDLKNQIDEYRKNSSLDLTDYDKKILEELSSKLYRIEQQTKNISDTLKIISGN